MKNIIYIILLGLICFSRANSSNNKSVSIRETLIGGVANEVEIDSRSIQGLINVYKDSTTDIKDTFPKENKSIGNWLLEFKPYEMIKIGPKREFNSLGAYFFKVKEARNVHIVIDEGTYYDKSIYVKAEDVIIEGTGSVNLYCTDLYENVLEISGTNILVKNMHMMHLQPGSIEDQNCTGRVVMFDNANNVIIDNCDLNGCGLAGLHDNTGNSDILIKNCYIHNNSLGAYTNIEGEIWMKEVNNHPVFSFENNRIENNGPNRINELIDIDTNLTKTNKSEYRNIMVNDIELWKNLANPLIVKYTGSEFGDYFHIYFEDTNGMEYDFGFGNNNYGNYKLYENPGPLLDNPIYLNKSFKLYWKWKLSTFPCCDGEYNPTKGLQPSIIKLELINPNTDKK